MTGTTCAIETESSPRLVVLDRDGVINAESEQFIKAPEEFIPLPGSIAAIARLSRSGYTVLVATNQSGIARGLLSRHTLDAIHEKLRHLVREAGGRLGGIYSCPHAPQHGCDCRKPQPGLLRQVLRDYPVRAAQVMVIGDSLRDLEMALNAGACPVLVKTGNGMRTYETLRGHKNLNSVAVFENLAQAAQALTEHRVNFTNQ